MLILIAPAAVLASVAVVVARGARERVRTAIWWLAGSFVGLTLLLPLAGSYDCSDSCGGPNVAIPWLWLCLGLTLIVVCAWSLVARLRWRHRSRRSSA